MGWMPQRETVSMVWGTVSSVGTGTVQVSIGGPLVTVPIIGSAAATEKVLVLVQGHMMVAIGRRA
jgi:hypothetical protein